MRRGAFGQHGPIWTETNLPGYERFVFHLLKRRCEGNVLLKLYSMFEVLIPVLTTTGTLCLAQAPMVDSFPIKFALRNTS